MDEWFRWEREAAIHLLFPTLEGSMQQLEEFNGHGFPTTILIFKNGIVTWCVKNTEFYGLGAKLLKIYKDPTKEREMVEAAVKRLNELRIVEEKIDHFISDLTNEKLRDLYNQLHYTFTNYYGIGAIQEPLALQAEVELKEASNLSSDEIAHLVAPEKLSYVQEADNYLIDSKDVNGFIIKYYWIDNNYSQTKVLSKKEVEKRLSSIKPSNIPNEKSLNINLSKEAERLIEILKSFATYQDDRKRNILVYLHYLEILLKEMGKRANISLQVMRDTFPQEIEDVLNGKITESFINKRREKCFVVWEEGKNKPEILIGEDTKKWEEILSSKINSNTKIVKGNCASKGRVTGKVRILLNASENDKLEKGEVLVTFMTSPDFMSAARKCSAIVTNLGGITSHAAIISRELGIPCIVGTKNGTEILKTGDLVEVDANKGEVKILPE